MRVRPARAGAALAVCLLAASTACSGGSGGRSLGPVAGVEQGPARLPEQVVLISVEGLTAGRYRSPAGEPTPMPTLASMARAGVAADGLHTVAPASRYPAHATLMSGHRPARHGIVADRRLGDHGVRNTPYWHASQLRVPTLWQVAVQAGLRVAALAWPSTVGASIPLNLPDLAPQRPGERWPALLRDRAHPQLVAWALEAGGDADAAQSDGPARDAVLTAVACRLLGAQKPPNLLLLHLSETAPALALEGVDSPAVAAAFARVDAHITRLIDCVRERGRLEQTAFAVVGDHGATTAHTLVQPNVALADAGLLTPDRQGSLLGWSAIARSNGGSAFVYARVDADAVLARRALEGAALRSAAFRVVSAEEMLRIGADPEAWFGLEAEPGFLFGDGARGPLTLAAGGRGAWGYLPDHAGMDAAFVAWGAGLRAGLLVPGMRQTDVAPTLARLLGLQLPDAEGRVMVGVLHLPAVSAVPARGSGSLP